MTHIWPAQVHISSLIIDKWIVHSYTRSIEYQTHLVQERELCSGLCQYPAPRTIQPSTSTCSLKGLR